MADKAKPFDNLAPASTPEEAGRPFDAIGPKTYRQGSAPDPKTADETAAEIEGERGDEVSQIVYPPEVATTNPVGEAVEEASDEDTSVRARRQAQRDKVEAEKNG